MNIHVAYEHTCMYNIHVHVHVLYTHTVHKQVQSIPRRTHVPPLTDASVNAHTVRWSTDGGLSCIMVDTYLLNTIIQSY